VTGCVSGRRDRRYIFKTGFNNSVKLEHTVEGEFSVANFLVNIFYRLRGRPVACSGFADTCNREVLQS